MRRIDAPFDDDEPPTLPGSPRSGPLAGFPVDERLPVVEPEVYEIEGVFAQGGIGRILRARDKRLDRSVALKELLDARAGAAERFVREALVTARLQHPAIIPIYEAGRWPTGQLFYAMKFVSGRSLEVILVETSTLAQRLALLPHVLTAAEAVAYAHSHRIVHRDLKPANILIGTFGETLVIDWGLAKDLNETVGFDLTLVMDGREGRSSAPSSGEGLPPSSRPSITVAGTVMGTPAYMPWEQALGKPVDERADVYALGAILYDVLAGGTPYEGEDAESVLFRVAAGPPTPLEQRQKGIPEELIAIVNKAMHRDPEQRYPTAKELAEDLRRFETGQIVDAHRYSAAARLLRVVRRYRTQLLVTLAALVVILIGGGIGVQRVIAERDRAEQKGAEATRRADDLTIVHARDALDRDPGSALGWLKTLSPGSSQWRAARTLAADARSRGVSRVLRGHTLGFSRIGFSPDGKTIITASDDRTARLWDVATGQSRALVGHTGEVWDAVFSPDGKLVATRSQDRTIRLWDPKTGEHRTLKHKARILHISFSPNGKLLASQALSEGVWLWDVASGAGQFVHTTGERDIALSFSADGRMLGFIADGVPMLYVLRQDASPSGPAKPGPSGIVELRGQGTPARAMAISPDGERFATLGWDGSVRLWSSLTGAPGLLPGHAAEGRAIAFAPDGRTLVSTAMDSSLRVSDIATGKSRLLRGHDGVIYTMKISPDGRQIATAASDHTVRLWDIATGRSRVLRGFTDAVLSVAFSPDGALVAAAGAAETARVWDLRATGERVVLHVDSPIATAAISPDGKHIVAGSDDGKVAFGAFDDRQTPAQEAHGARVRDIEFAPDGSSAASAGQDGTVQLWSVAGERRMVLRGHRGGVTDIVFSPDAKRLYSAGDDGTVQRWDVASSAPEVLHQLSGPATALAISQDGTRVGVGAGDGGVWLLGSREAARRLGSHRGRVTEAMFSPDSRFLATGSDDHTISLWELASGGARTMDTSGDGPKTVVFFPDGRAVAASTGETMVRLWHPVTGEPQPAIGGHAAPVQTLAVSPEGKRLVAGSIDGTVWLWDLASGKFRTLVGHSAEITWVGFSPDGKAVLSASRDGDVRVWPDDLPDDEAGLKAWLAEAAREDG